MLDKTRPGEYNRNVTGKKNRWMEEGSMDSRVERFYNGLKGKKISVIGIGVSHSDLISRLRDYGAKVTAHDRRARSAVGEAICNNFEA